MIHFDKEIGDPLDHLLVFYQKKGYRLGFSLRFIRGLEGEWSWGQKGPWVAASLIKLPILAYLLERAEKGEVDLEQRVKVGDCHQVFGAGVLPVLSAGTSLELGELAALMITVSDNAATNTLIEKLGMSELNQFFQGRGWCETSLARKMMEPSSPKKENFISLKDTQSCLSYLLDSNVQGLSEASRERARYILSQQQFIEKIPLVLGADACWANKTGELDGLRHDACRVWWKEYLFDLVVFASRESEKEEPSGSSLPSDEDLDQAIREIAKVIMKGLRKNESGKIS